MDELIEEFVDNNFKEVERFEANGIFYIRVSKNNKTYIISRNKAYIVTIDDQYVLVTINPNEIVNVVKKLMDNQTIQVDDFTRMVASLSNNQIYNN